MRYSEAYKRRVQEMARDRTLLCEVIRDSIDPDPGEPRAALPTIRRWVQSERGKYGQARKVTPERIQQAVDMVLRGSSLQAAADAVNMMHGIRSIDARLVRNALPIGYVYQAPPRSIVSEAAADRRWKKQTRDEAERLVLIDGLTPMQARRRMIRNNGAAPSAETIARWTGVAASALATPAPNIKPLPDQPDDLDTYERAWAAAEGLDGAAWADAVMRTWLPPDDTTASEPDIRVLSTRRRAA